LLACTFDYFLVVCATVRLLPEGRSWDCTASIFLHQLTIDYFKQLNISTIENGTTDASGTDHASGYNLKLSRLFVVFVLFLYRLSANTNDLYAAILLLILNSSMIFLLDFGIKIYHKITKRLT
jgi:hypothetical protein